MLDRDILPAIAAFKAKDVVRLDVIRLLDAIKNRGTPIRANRVHEVVRRVYSWSMARDDSLLVNLPWVSSATRSRRAKRS